MERQSGLSELSVISWVSAIEGCPLSGVPLYVKCSSIRGGGKIFLHNFFLEMINSRACSLLEISYTSDGNLTEILKSSPKSEISKPSVIL